MNRLKKVGSIVATSLLLPTLALAGLEKPPQPGGLNIFGAGSTVTDVVLYFINLGLAVVGIICVAFIIFGGFRYVTSAGNDETAESAKKIILNAVIGLVVTILSYVVVIVIINAVANNNVR